MQDWRCADDKSTVGIIFVHGFTGSPVSMRPWAEFFVQRGYTVSVPLLPGHGTTPHDLNQVAWKQWPEKVEEELHWMLDQGLKVFICGLSMGGGTTLHVAEKYNDVLQGVVLVNPMIHVKFVTPHIAWLISRFQKMRDSVGDDIKRPGVTEHGYDQLPARGVHQLLKMLSYTRKRLHDVTIPVQLFHSKEDHVLPVTNTEIVMNGIGSLQKSRIELLNSYHVATLDYDQELIFENSLIFIKDHS
jgi:carboxylesterase